MRGKIPLIGIVLLVAAGAAQVRADDDRSKAIQGGGTTIL